MFNESDHEPGIIYEVCTIDNKIYIRKDSQIFI